MSKCMCAYIAPEQNRKCNHCTALTAEAIRLAAITARRRQVESGQADE